ncbi:MULTISPECIES: dihydrodipicolinate synthase family protein [Flavobacteriaceae]|uniref:dihydrodipicolinate synthase family protein n=1 Tax=Flavobacteriaceae TaxID=49546 RepID=UPI00149143B2|nr:MULTISPECIES: dihydrodipicolinate synthase family protein [Allomuricauda]MDC6366813.1 dihydrodipicolinate synthase family protein [Muricauda sp. AC10]
MGIYLTPDKRKKLQEGMVIPAHPTALTKKLLLDEKRQRALSRYYLESGVGGLAIGVHTSQFEIREAGLQKAIFELGKEEEKAFVQKTSKEVLMVAGVMGNTKQARAEATMAADLGYDAVLLCLAGLAEKDTKVLVTHCHEIAQIIPVIGFYLQPSVGGMPLGVDFWREFASIENVVAIKMAPFDRYKTLDVVHGVVASGRSKEVALYTGNDDNIVPDLLTTYEIPCGGTIVKKEIVGGLLGHWAVWTKKAVAIFNEIKTKKEPNITALLTKGIQITDANAAFFDAKNKFKGSIAGIHEVLIRQGFLEANYTLNPNEKLSPGQKEEIDRVYAAYPDLNDDAFVSENIERWLN